MWHFCKHLYAMIIAFGTFLQPFILLAMRLYWGFLFFQTGLGKLSHIEDVGVFFASLNIPFPIVNAYLAAIVECVGGICLLIGFASRLAAIPLVGTMVVAYSTAHIESVRNIFENPEAFVTQAPFNFLLTALIILAFGPGAFSIDALIKKIWFTPPQNL